VTFRLLRIAGACLVMGACGACSTVRVPLPAGAAARVELSEVPFFAQRRYQCGPAALATVLGASGVAVSPDELTPEVYLPARRGSLQAELLATLRRRQRVPLLLAPTLVALVRELDAGRPVLVLQNFGLSIAPRWHYAVVVGYESAGNRFILRSGTNVRSRVAASRFEGTWDRAGNWAVVVLRPAELPADADAQRYLEAVSAVESAGQPQAAELSYRSALQRWPDDARAWLGLGNLAAGSARWPEAERAYRNALRQRPEDVAARNNLAMALFRQGCLQTAAAEIAHAASAAGTGPLAAEVADSVRQIRAGNAAVDSAACRR
jgi:Tetratricopeptide repeat